jgi:hypothetical protein
MSETVEEKELIQCARCKSTMLVKYFSINKKGQLYKTCDNCREKRRKKNPNGTKKLTIEYCREIGNELNWTLLSDTYINSRQKLEWQCDNGHITFCNIDSVRTTQQCLQCYNMRRGDTCRGNIDECKKVAEEREGLCLSKKYVSRREKMLWQCSEGHQWEAKFAHIKNSNEWCPKCSKYQNRYSIEDCNKVAEERGGKCLSNEYNNSREKLLWQCSEGHQWETCFDHIKNHKSWCPYCTGYRSEELTRTLMEELYGEKFPKVRPKWLGGLELDGYNEDLKIGFEYNGIQHYQYRPHFHRNGIEDLYKQQKNDHRKYEICKERGIHLIVIPNQYSYKDEDEMRKFLEKNL